MKFAIVFTSSTLVLALATAVTIPYQKSSDQNEMFHEHAGNNHGNDYETFQELEERNSIANSFDAIASIVRQYKNEMTGSSGLLNSVQNEISIPDTVNVGNGSDTLLTQVSVKGLKNVDSQNVTMSWGEDVVNAENSWEKLTVYGMFHHMNSVARCSGGFEIVLVEPKYSGNTSLTKNANIYPTMSPASSITFKKAVIYHTKLPEVFQDDKPQFDNFVKNVVCQYVATAVATSMYNDITMNVRQSARPYLTYQSNKIGGDAAAFNGQLDNGFHYEFKNMRFDNAKNNLAKISFVQMNNTDQMSSAKFQLRLLDLTGESDWSVTADGKDFGGNVAFKFDRVYITPALDLNDKTVRTKVSIKNPQIDYKGGSVASPLWTNAVKDQLTDELVEYFVQKLAEATSRNVQNSIM